MKISCVVPTLNSAKTLDHTLMSLRAQTGVDVRIIVVDSGSRDGTLDICQRWDVATLYAPPGNIYHAINTGLRTCQDEWVTYLNSDDFVYADSYARLIALGDRTGADVVYGGLDYVDAAGRFLHSFGTATPRQLRWILLRKMAGIYQPAAIFHRALYERLNGFDERFRFASDADFFKRALAVSRFMPLKGATVACFRLHAGQMSQKSQDLNRADDAILFSRGSPAERRVSALVYALWRFQMLPNYVLRMMRASVLAGRLILPSWMYGSVEY